MPSNSRQHGNGGIQLTVTPASSAFFSGEVLEFKITFKNTRPRVQHNHQSAAAAAGTSSSSTHPYQHHAKHQSTSSLAIPASAPAGTARSVFAHQQHQHHLTPPGTATASPSRSYADLSAFASHDNRSGTSSHIVLPERKGIIGTPLALASSSSGTSSITSPTQYFQRRQHTPIPSSSSRNLYPNKRVPSARHKKNDYSVAGANGDSSDHVPGSAVSAASSYMDDGYDQASSGVSDLSSQLAGMALLHQRDGSIQEDGEEDVAAIVDAQPFVEKYKRQGDALQSRFPSFVSNGSMRNTSGFSTISEDDGDQHLSPPASKRFPGPRRSLSYSSAMAVDTSRRIPSNSSTTTAAFEHLDQSNDYHSPSTNTPGSAYGFYGVGNNESVDSVLRDTVTDYTRPDTLRRYASGTSSATNSPTNSLRPTSSTHGRSFSAAAIPRPGSAPIRALPPTAISEDSTLVDDNGTETLLWTFAQFQGTFTIEEALVKNNEFVAIKKALFGSVVGKSGAGGHTAGMGEYAIGGGSLDTEAALPSPAAGTVSGKLASWLWGTNNTTSTIPHGNSGNNNNPHSRESTASSDHTFESVAAGNRRKSSSAATVLGNTSQGPFSASSSSSNQYAHGSLEERRNRAMNDKNYPVFNSPPSILAVDLTLEPGESKSYTFSLQLPGDLPPSFRGKAITFQYTLMVGTNRAPNRSLGEWKQQSRLIKIPVRIYNHVSVTGVRPFYDLTNPIIWSQDEAKITCEEDDAEDGANTSLNVPGSSEDLLTRLPSNAIRSRKGRTTSMSTRMRSGSIENAYAAARRAEQKKEFLSYAEKLLDASVAIQEQQPHVNGSNSPRRSPSLPPPPTIDGQEMERSFSDGGPAARPELMQRTSSSSSYAVLNGNLLSAEGEEISCKNAVEIVSRNAQKVSYDINKDGYKIATLTLVKSAYRLGDTVNIMISLNEGAARVLRLAARLETHELIETTVSMKSPSQVRQLTRRLHAEHHETTLDSGRAGFALAIPSGATPDFATSGVKLQWSLRVALLILPPQAPRSTPGLSGSYAAHRGGAMTPMASASSVGLSSASSSSSSLPLPSPGHAKSKSFAFSGTSQLGTPVPVETGTHHLLPLPSIHPHQQYTSYRAVPDLSFVPTLFQSPEVQAHTEKMGGANLSLHGNEDDVALQSGAKDASAIAGGQGETVVLMPTKIETVEVNIPLRVYPSATPFRPHVSTFAV